ncbi:MAG: HAMP domain-containing histidine kinase [Saprospiraceae bacterium]|jgi:two-component system phosphate regulon sensor histidine kinase PhoR|nr:HAMP domain-containing histidine kinase [Saprospiraceae bacterium]HRD79190.1 HAMP domain-containing sensor histidine kinase [Saprospiraceae bacterium]HRF37460.1 HAMP domain-containing sensor histidine kinase [Saprospiraceae bacterium]HRK80659.1 HAMP domain-containing sensor histidine kinase [Saprospiraceae bacterium]
MKNSTIFRVILLGVVAIAGIIAIQSYWVMSSWNLNEDEFQKKVNLALYNTARSLADLNGHTLPARNVVRQRSGNYFVVNIAYEINTEDLEFFLQRELEELALNIDFEYAVFDCETDEMMYGDYVSYSPNQNSQAKTGELPKHSEFTYYFGVRFPTRTDYLLNRIQLSILFSVILFVAVIFFAYSMAVILKQKQLSETQKDFINNMTHEFKTPISTMGISADVLLNSPAVQAEPRLLQYAKIIKEQNQRLNHQVEKVLQLARIEKGNFQIKPEKMELDAFLEQAIQGMQIQAEQKGGAISGLFHASGCIIQADRLHLTNVVNNLLDNALKYCADKPQVIVTTICNKGRVTLSIKDNGIGIAKENTKKIFHKFYRVPTGNVHDVKGFGLGLYYVRNICQAHRWQLRVESTPGAGTDFQISIPLAP